MTARHSWRNPRVLHVIVGHGLPTYFLNAVRSVRAAVPLDEILVIDNASPDEALRQELSRIGKADDRMQVVLRDVNDFHLNGKVGSLYAAYEVAIAYALERHYDLLHLVQADFQMLWWDGDVVAKSLELFEAHPNCVNIQTLLLSKDKLLANELAESTTPGVFKLRKYGLTDTGLYHLGRWETKGLRFDDDERVHAQRYLDDGMEVLCHPWPTDAPLPWPAAMRRGRQKGREVRTGKPFLLRPISPETIAGMKQPACRTWLEDVCIPWGWVCLTPMLVTTLDSVDYWALRYRDMKENGLSHLLPGLETRGVTWGQLVRSRPPFQHRPSITQLFFTVPARQVGRRLRSLPRPWYRSSRGSVGSPSQATHDVAVSPSAPPTRCFPASPPKDSQHVRRS